MTNDIERHSPDEWRKTAAALMPESSSAGAEESAATAKVNANGAPLLGILVICFGLRLRTFRPSLVCISGAMGKGASFM